jgi:hypothetical protein
MLWISMGSDRQKSSASCAVPGSAAAAAPTIKRDQARRFWIAMVRDVRAAAISVEAIEQSRQQHRARAVDPLEVGQTDVHRAAAR